jgi:hypothetical protein
MGAFIMYREELGALGAAGAFLVLIPMGEPGWAFISFLEAEAPLVFAVFLDESARGAVQNKNRRSARMHGTINV